MHARLTKALRRVVLLWEERNPERLLPGGTEKERGRLRAAVLRFAERSATGHRNHLQWPGAAPAELQAALTVQLQSWRSAFSDALPCPTPEFVTPAKLPSLFAWSFALQRQRVEVTRELAGLHGGREDEAVRRLAGLARAVRVLPLWSCHVHAICVYPTSLASLSEISAELVGGNPRKRKRCPEEDDEHEETPLDFWSFFPGARRLLKGGRGGTLLRPR